MTEKSRYCFFCFSINNWEKRKARKQQFMLHLSRREDVDKVLYIEPPLNFWHYLFHHARELADAENKDRWQRALKGQIKALSDKLFLYTPIFFIPLAHRCQWLYDLNLRLAVRVLEHRISKWPHEKRILWFYHPMAYRLLDYFSDRALAVFDWAEEWAQYFIEFGQKKRQQIKGLEEKVLRDTELVFVVSDKMKEEAERLNKNAHQLLDGTSYEQFQDASLPVPDDMKEIPRPILGYLGTVTERIDSDTLVFAAKQLPKVSFVFVGAVHDIRVDMTALRECKNIIFLGEKKYEDLGAYARQFAVCLLPYKPQPETSLSPPTKIFDYFATGKPIVANYLDSLSVWQDQVGLARTPEEFLSLVRSALVEDDSRQASLRMEIAKANSWMVRTDDIMDHVRATLDTKEKKMPEEYTLHPPKIKMLRMELTNACNFDCSYCAEHMMCRKKGVMDISLAKKIIDDVQHSQISDVIGLQFMGEGLLHPRFNEIAVYAKECGVKLKLVTNGSLLTDQRIDNILANEISDVYVSYFTPDEYSYHLRGANKNSVSYAEYEARVKNLIREKIWRGSKTKLSLGFLNTRYCFLPGMKSIDDNRQAKKIILSWVDFIVTAQQEQNVPSNDLDLNEITGADDFPDNWTFAVADDIFITFIEVGVWANQFLLKEGIKVQAKEHGFCASPFEQLFISWDGVCTPCCLDYDCRIVVGDANNESLTDIWNGQRFQELRQGILEGRLVNPYCQVCRGKIDPLTFFLKANKRRLFRILFSKEKMSYVFKQGWKRFR